jgi:hypothetical protein
MGFRRLTDALRELVRELRKLRRRRVRFQWAVGPVGNKAPRKQIIMDITITNEQKIPVRLEPKTAGDKPSSVDVLNSTPTWEVISGDATLAVDADGLGATLISGDNPGDSEILVKADADLGEGVEEISDVIRLHVSGARAVNLGITAGTPTLK